MNKMSKTKRILMTTCLVILCLFTVSIAVRLFTRQVLIARLGMDNAFTRLVFWDNATMAGTTEEEESDPYDYDWSADYPFADASDNIQPVVETDSESWIDQYTNAVDSVESRIENYTQDELAGYEILTRLGNKYKSFIHWNFTSFSEYNGTIKMSDGYWTSFNEEVDQAEHAQNLAELRDYCEKDDIDFLYVQFPHKISEYEDTDISGTVDFTNQNADQLLELADEYDVTTLDLREAIHDAGVSNHSLFYVTDHHWKAETGFWATGVIADFINEVYGYDLDLEKLDAENFYSVEYTESFLGSYGTKVTTANATPDDLCMLYPEYETLLHFTVPSLNVDVTGDFSVTYNMDEEGEYGAYGYGDHALIQYENLMEGVTEKKILVIHDSFANSVLPFLSLTVSEIDAIDLRYFNGSLETYIEKTEPDMVIVMRYAGELSTVREPETHADSFDFR